MRAVTLVTGASSGIGAALAQVFAEHGHDEVVGEVRVAAAVAAALEEAEVVGVLNRRRHRER